MKKSNRTVRKMRSAWTGFTTACLAAALTMSALVSCAPQESRPVVTSDDLTPPSAAQEAIAQEAGGGKNYAYYWQAENAEETLQMLREAYEQEVNDAKELIAKGEEAVKAAGYPSLAEARQGRHALNRIWQTTKKDWKQSLRWTRLYPRRRRQTLRVPCLKSCMGSTFRRTPYCCNVLKAIPT